MKTKINQQAIIRFAKFYERNSAEIQQFNEELLNSYLFGKDIDSIKANAYRGALDDWLNVWKECQAFSDNQKQK